MNIRTWDCDYPQDLGFELPPQEAVEINKSLSNGKVKSNLI